MAQQLIYTSASKLLDAGRSGFGTVARSKSISPLLVSAIERVSQFANIRGTERSRVIFVHRRIIAANNRVHLLSRIADAGADYTGRTNHIAHHLIVSQEEMNRAAASGINPADVLSQFPWFFSWEGAPKYFGPEDDMSLERLVQSRGGIASRNAWTRLTGNPIHARLLAWDGAPRNGVLLVPVDAEPLGLLSEALAEFGAQSWSRTFTTNLETTDEMADFDWVVSSPENFREIEARCGARVRLDASQPQTLPVPHEIVASKQQTAPSRMTGAHGSNGQATTPRVESYVEGRAASKASTEGPSRIPVPTIYPQSRKKHTLTLVAIAAALVLTGVILSRTVMDSKDLKDPPKISAAEKVEDKARRILEEVGVSPGKIDEYVKNPGEKHDEWANHASALLSKFQPSLNNNELRSGSEGKPEGQTRSAWLNKLDAANDVLAEYDRIDHKDYYERIKKLNVVYARLKEVAKELSNQPLSEEEAINFCKPLVQSELKKLFGGEDWTSHGNEEIKAILCDHFGEENPCAYETLCEYIRDHFNKFVGDSMEEIFCDATTIPSQDAKNLKQALACWKDPNEPFSDELKKIAGKGFVPKEFGKLLDEHRSKNQILEPNEVAAPQKPNELTDSEMPVGLDFSSVPEKEIIIVTREQLGKGVEVALLKALMGGDLNDDNRKKHLNKFLKIDGKDVDLTPVSDKEYFSKNYLDANNDREPKIHKDGRYSLANTDAPDVSLSITNGEKTCEAWIVIHMIGRKPIRRLPFHLEEKGENEVRLLGEIVEWMKVVKGGYDVLKLESQQATTPLRIEKNGQDYSIARDPVNASLLFAAADIEKVKKALEDLENKGNEISQLPGGSKKKEAEAERPPLVSNLREALCKAIGGAVLLEELRLTSHEQITKDNWQKAQDVLNKLMKKDRNTTYKDNWEKDIEDIKDKIGNEKLDEFLQTEAQRLSMGSSFNGWDKFTKTSSTQISKLVKKIIEDSKNHKTTRSLHEDLQQIKTFNVTTMNGRVLFGIEK
jgi:hypothetical protein